MNSGKSEAQDKKRVDREVERLMSLHNLLRMEADDGLMIDATLRHIGALQGSDEERRVYELWEEFGDDYVDDLIVAFYYEGAARRAKDIGGEHEARIPGIESTITQLRVGLNLPRPGRAELESLVDPEKTRNLAHNEVGRPG